MRRPQVIWAGLMGEVDRLKHLASAIEAGSAEIGFRPETREFRAHLTLGRVNGGQRPSDQAQLLEFLERARVEALGEFRIDHLSLMRSELRPGGSLYTPLFVTPLGRGSESPAGLLPKERASGTP
jgi:2'-5' RNA ligase